MTNTTDNLWYKQILPFRGPPINITAFIMVTLKKTYLSNCNASTEIEKNGKGKLHSTLRRTIKKTVEYLKLINMITIIIRVYNFVLFEERKKKTHRIINVNTNMNTLE